MSTVKSFNADKYITVDCQHLTRIVACTLEDDSWGFQLRSNDTSNLIITRETLNLRATTQNNGCYIKCPSVTTMIFNNTDEANRVFSALAFQDVEDHDDNGICQNIGHDPKHLSIQDLSSEKSREYSFTNNNKIEIPESDIRKLLVTNNGSHVILSHDDSTAIITIIAPSFSMVEWVSYPDQPTLIK